MSPQSIYNNSLYVPRTTPYHPQGNGATKQMHCTLNWTMMGLDFFKPKIRGQGLFQHWNLRAMTFFVHDYHGTFNFFSLPKSRGAEFFVQKNHGAQSCYAEKNHGAQSFLYKKITGRRVFMLRKITGRRVFCFKTPRGGYIFWSQDTLTDRSRFR